MCRIRDGHGWEFHPSVRFIHLKIFNLLLAVAGRNTMASSDELTAIVCAFYPFCFQFNSVGTKISKQN